MVLWIASKINPHPEVLTRAKPVIQPKPYSDSVGLPTYWGQRWLDRPLRKFTARILLTISYQFAPLLSRRSCGHCDLKAEFCQPLHQAAFHLVFVETLEEVRS